MAIDTLIAYVGVYGSVADAEADYQLVKELHVEAGLIDGYDAAVIERRDGGKTKIVTATGGGLLVGATDGGAILGLKADTAELERDAASAGATRS